MTLHPTGRAIVFIVLVPVWGLASPPPVPAAGPAQGRIVSMRGQVEHSPAEQATTWDPARALQPLFTADRVRTHTASRAAILFVDETQVKLNADSLLTVHSVHEEGVPTRLRLPRGEGWFRTKNRASELTIETPAVTAAIRGTEVDIRVDPDATTVMTVVEGAADFSNPFGSIVVSAGEEGTARPGSPPTKRLILEPEDAVQWVLYYPTRRAQADLPPPARDGPAGPGFACLGSDDGAAALALFRPLMASDPWARIGASAAHAEMGDVAEALAVLASKEMGPIEVERRAQLAAAALGTGDARRAREELEQALALDPQGLRPLVLLSTLDLTQNRQEEAAAAARRALDAHPESVGAHIAASEAAQALFDLGLSERLLDEALAIDPDSVHALVNRARLRFGRGDTPGAREDAARGASLAPQDAAVRSLLGFIELAEGHTDAAREHFEASSAADPELGEPHLGLGLVHFKESRPRDGLLEMLTATLLEPRVSLYQSYLGKSYYQSKRLEEGLSALDTAKRLDPRDPTPWLYASFFLRDLNRQVAAVEQLQRAIELNGNRAVYRSRFLLDRDRATKNVSLAEVYRELGFEPWGAHEALLSTESDHANPAAHLFLAGTFGRMPGRGPARRSELLQHWLLAPVNQNSFNTFNEYTALLEQPRHQLVASVRGGSEDYLEGTLASAGGNDRWAHLVFGRATRMEGARPDRPDETRIFSGQFKLALGSRSDLFLDLGYARLDNGQPREVTLLLDEDGDDSVPVDIDQVDDRDPTETSEIDIGYGTLGLRHAWSGGSTLTAALQFQDVGGGLGSVEDLDLLGWTIEQDVSLAQRFWALQVQQTWRLGAHQIVAGLEGSRTRDEIGYSESLIFAPDLSPLIEAVTLASDRDGLSAWARGDLRLAPSLRLTVGARLDDVRREESIATRFGFEGFEVGDAIDETREESVFDKTQLNPMLGLAWEVAPGAVVRLAAFRRLNTDIFGARISPSTVSGFVLDRSELYDADRREAGLQFELSRKRGYVSVSGFARRTDIPPLVINPIPEGDDRIEEYGGDLAFNRILSQRFSLFAGAVAARTRRAFFDYTDARLWTGLSFIHERNIFARVTVSYGLQRFDESKPTQLEDVDFGVVDIGLGYQFAQRRGFLSFDIGNLFNSRFLLYVPRNTLELVPGRRLSASLSFTF